MKNIFKYIIVVLLLFIVVILLVYRKDINEKILPTSEVATNTFQNIAINGIIIKAELATTPEAQTLGLSGRESLKENEGMLFIFEKPSVYHFWMKDMNFPIDIIFFDENAKIVHIKENAQPESYPDLFGPKEDVKYVLETVAHFTSKNKIKIGDYLAFIPSN